MVKEQDRRGEAGCGNDPKEVTVLQLIRSGLNGGVSGRGTDTLSDCRSDELMVRFWSLSSLAVSWSGRLAILMLSGYASRRHHKGARCVFHWEERWERQKPVPKDRTFCQGMWPQTLDIIHPGSELGKQGFVEEDQLPSVFLENDAVMVGEEVTAHRGVWMANGGPANGSNIVLWIRETGRSHLLI